MSTNGLSVTIGQNIRRARLAAGLTQNQLAAAIGASSLMAVSRWETGTHRPSDVFLVQLSAVLGHDPAWFYTDHEPVEPTERTAA